jgi:hypothetical protein
VGEWWLALRRRASDVVVVDVGAVGPLSRDLLRALRRVHTRVTATGGALVLLDAAGDHGLTPRDGDLVHQGLPASRPIPA